MKQVIKVSDFTVLKDRVIGVSEPKKIVDTFTSIYSDGDTEDEYEVLVAIDGIGMTPITFSTYDEAFKEYERILMEIRNG